MWEREGGRQSQGRHSGGLAGSEWGERSHCEGPGAGAVWLPGHMETCPPGVAGRIWPLSAGGMGGRQEGRKEGLKEQRWGEGGKCLKGGVQQSDGSKGAFLQREIKTICNI